MGSGNNSRAGAGDRSNNRTNRGRKAVKKKLKLVTQIAGPIKVKKKVGLETGKPLYSAKGGKANFMYGGAASKATDDYLVETKQVKVGNYFKKVGGEFIRISKSEGEKLYKAGDPSISRSTIGNTKSKELKYGKSGGAMGSGDATGIMTSIPISAEMHKSQQKTKALLVAGLSLAAGPIGGTLMRAEAADAYNSTYKDYEKSFKANMTRTAAGDPKHMASPKVIRNEVANVEGANLAFGTVIHGDEKIKSKKHKKTTRRFAGIHDDEKLLPKRKFY